ncbi:antitoxin HicB [Rhodopseudomonas julia]|uniref:Antitoxin HicB n=1 Tax=Rhodopseudomonas julia TaxID=200617 RepID=A0ABU0C1X4_9BRAD|nr:type II toxin-antitoxin system HicB family antitoxin [Rhodopseudomonas julia]MDQ0324511.1 antitoxin HicB [Rhodopseudomonas julia]
MYYEIVIEMDEAEDGTLSWLVSVPEFPEITTFGETKEEACQNGLKAIEEAIAARIADGEAIPAPRHEPCGHGHSVQLPALIFLKALLYMLSKSKGVTRAELSRRLGWHREQVDRLFRLDHKSQLDQLEAAFEAIGVPLAFDISFPEAA